MNLDFFIGIIFAAIIIFILKQRFSLKLHNERQKESAFENEYKFWKKVRPRSFKFIKERMIGKVITNVRYEDNIYRGTSGFGKYIIFEIDGYESIMIASAIPQKVIRYNYYDTNISSKQESSSEKMALSTNWEGIWTGNMVVSIFDFGLQLSKPSRWDAMMVDDQTNDQTIEGTISNIYISGHLDKKNTKAIHGKKLKLVRGIIFEGDRGFKMYTYLHPLIDAAIKNDMVTLQKMLAEGVNVNYKDAYGRTAWSSACKKGHFEMVKYLHENRSDIILEDTILYDVAKNEHIELLKLLCEKFSQDEIISTLNLYEEDLRSHKLFVSSLGEIDQSLKDNIKNMDEVVLVFRSFIT